MNCIYCGAQNEPICKFCSQCGRKLRNQFCSACGSKLVNDPKFCPKCGKQVIEEIRPVQGKNPSNNIVKPPLKKRWLIIAAGGAIFIIILVSVLASAPGSGRVTGKLNIGAPTQVAQGTTGPKGGSIMVDSGGASVLDGMTISVPEGAYENQIDFTVSEAPIQSQTFGEDFLPISPLISVDNGEVFATEPLEVTIPIHLDDGQFAMGFYYNAEDGTLEGIPLLNETDTSITLMTRHFSDIYVAMAKKGKILGRAVDGIYTGFEPGKNDFIMPNAGSYVKPKGFCAGQCIAELYYYLQSSRGGQWSGQLYGRFDNNGLGDTPAFFEDDANAMRLCTMMHFAETPNWYNGTEVAEYHKFRDQRNDEETFYALAYAMMGTSSPQLVYCASSSSNGAHMVLAYKIVGDVIYVADPNFPADVSAERTITFDRATAVTNNASPKLTPYYSAINAEEAQKAGEKPYDIISYYGMFALVDQLTANGVWQNFLDGKVPGIGVFPDDLKLYAFTGLKETDTGEMEKDIAPIKNGLVVHESRLKETAAAGGKLFIYAEYPKTIQDGGFNVYIGDKQVKTEKIPSMPGYFSFSLQPGENDVGIYFLAVNPNYPSESYRFVNFYRFKIIYDAAAGASSPSVEPSIEVPTPEYTDNIVTPEPTVESVTPEPEQTPSQNDNAIDYGPESVPSPDLYKLMSNDRVVGEWVEKYGDTIAFYSNGTGLFYSKHEKAETYFRYVVADYGNESQSVLVFTNKPLNNEAFCAADNNTYYAFWSLSVSPNDLLTASIIGTPATVDYERK